MSVTVAIGLLGLTLIGIMLLAAWEHCRNKANNKPTITDLPLILKYQKHNRKQAKYIARQAKAYQTLKNFEERK